MTFKFAPQIIAIAQSIKFTLIINIICDDIIQWSGS